MAKIFFPQYRKGREGIEIGEGTILDHARRLGVEIAGECGGLGKCKSCLVRIEKGSEALSQRTEFEADLASDERLACQARLVRDDTDVTLFIRSFGSYSILSESIEAKVGLDPFVSRRNGRTVHETEGDMGPCQDCIHGLAIDVGTTTLVVEALDLETGESLGVASRKNPQVSFGNDVISRIGHIMFHDDGLQRLRDALAQGISDALDDLESGGLGIRKHVYDIVAVGNPTMRGIAFGQDVSTLGVIPFEPASLDAVTLLASDLGIEVHPKAVAYAPPLIGGHAGADAVADVLATKIYEGDEVSMLIDIGTNGEVVIGNKNRLMSSSCAAGGAYEGASTKCGVGAIKGAITNVHIDDGKVTYKTIGNAPPVGVCGSGLIDALAELLRTGIMSKKAKIKGSFKITDDIEISQEDIYQLITAKAGLRLEQDLLMKYYGVPLDEVSKIYLAGAFGNFIDAENAVAIGLLPPAPEKVVRVGNGALAGARNMLLSKAARHTAEDIAEKIQHTKPNEHEPDFAYLVAERMYF